MTLRSARAIRPRLIALALFGHALFLPAPALAFAPFEVKDIRVEGIQRTEAGTVFSYLPVRVGETFTADKAAEAIKALFATGFFQDVRLEASDGVLIVMVQERPSIASLSFSGMREFNKDEIGKALKALGLAEGRILDRALLERAEQELKRQYFNRGMYAVEVRSVTTPLERNRVALSFEVSEGETARIKAINIVGHQAFTEQELLRLFRQRTTGLMSWWTRDDRYSRQTLAADLETLRSHYMNQGFLEFAIESTQVSITPDRQHIYITVNIKEGERFKVSEIRFAGASPLSEDEMKQLVSLRVSDVFSRELLNESTKRIGDRLGNDGFAFANVNAVPELDQGSKTAAFTFLVDPGRKVYVRRINVTGNTRTRDEVVRREIRQMEGGWFAADKINRSRERLTRLGFFRDVSIETPPVPGTTDQVDMNVHVEEQPTGSLLLGAGFSSAEGLVVSGSVSQSNLFGTGNRLALNLNSGSINTHYGISFTNPYFTQDGVSLGYDLYQRDVDTSNTRLTTVADFSTSTLGVGLRLGVPVTEFDTVHLGATFEQVDLSLSSRAPAIYTTFATAHGGNASGVDTTTLRLDAGWARDSRDSLLFPTKGTLQRVFAEWGTPAGDLQYYKLNYQHQWLRPLSRNTTLMLNGEIGLGGGLDGNDLPIFRNFFAGGIGSVRGFDSSALGPKQLNPAGASFSVGGDTRVVGNAELFFPFPGMGNDRSMRLSAFADVGQVFGSGDRLNRYARFSLADLRYSVGAAVTWFSPMGPIKLSFAQPLNAATDDEEQVFQFQLGNVF